MKTFLIRGQYGQRLGRFVAKNEAEALEMLARLHGYTSVAAADAAPLPGGRHQKPWSQRHRVFPVVEVGKPRLAKTDLCAILDMVLLTEEEQGTTGHLLRLGLHKMAGRITLDDIQLWLAVHTDGRDDREERAHWLGKMLPLVDSMRIAALEGALRDVGLDDLGYDVMRARWEGVPGEIKRVQAELARRRAATTDAGALFFLRAAEEAAAEVLEGRKGLVQKPRDE